MGDVAIEFIAKVHMDFEASTKFISFFVPAGPMCAKLCIYLALNPNLAISLDSGVGITGSDKAGEPMAHARELRFSGRVFVYADQELSEEETNLVMEAGKSMGLDVRVRGPLYAAKQIDVENPLAFISHDGRDKESIARPLAHELLKLRCPVWFDEYSLVVGASLRESIEDGIKRCKRCVLIVSKNFLGNRGWTKVEFNGVFTKEIVEKNASILPVWHEVSRAKVFDYSPSLADRYALDWSLGVAKIAKKLNDAVRRVPVA